MFAFLIFLALLFAFSHHRLCYYRKTYVRQYIPFEPSRLRPFFWSLFLEKKKRTQANYISFFPLGTVKQHRTNWTCFGLLIEFCFFLHNTRKNSDKEKKNTHFLFFSLSLSLSLASASLRRHSIAKISTFCGK
jgi:hypothetical protein